MKNLFIALLLLAGIVPVSVAYGIAYCASSSATVPLSATELSSAPGPTDVRIG